MPGRDYLVFAQNPEYAGFAVFDNELRNGRKLDLHWLIENVELIVAPEDASQTKILKVIEHG